MLLKSPPNENGIMELTEEEIISIKAKLQAIIDSFIPDDYQATITTQWLVAKYNEQNKGSEINGDTAEYILAYQPIMEQPIEEGV